MIKNEKQFKVTGGWLKKFTKALSEVKGDDLWANIERNAIKSQIDTFNAEIREYKRLKVRKTTSIGSVYKLGEMLIKARIMNNLTQKQFAITVGVNEQQIQRYEESNYESASLSTILNLATALNITSKSFDISIKKSNKDK